ncbi:MAG: hypothetical protein HOJ95_19080 [Nitrospinaceae bacterium]|nr:hypothetical protein [Nitrospinaceae bacterium]
MSTKQIPKETVRRHINWDKLGADLKESLAHLVQGIRRRMSLIAFAPPGWLHQLLKYGAIDAGVVDEKKSGSD